MRISFDLDETLICHHESAPVELGFLPSFLQKKLTEPLRLGAKLLFQQLREHGHDVWIYTTSSRTPMQIRWWLLLHGIRVNGIVNDKRHQTAIQGRRFERSPSKYPPAFGIDLHVDDSEGVRMEGEQCGFRVLVIQPGDEDWVTKVTALAL
ncbi:MAG: hypothetical protein HOP33_20835 [Verrucomicrobia bacterium]|nr:hypothetical protein [Verrucomicrobiota bacterium]